MLDSRARRRRWPGKSARTARRGRARRDARGPGRRASVSTFPSRSRRGQRGARSKDRQLRHRVGAVTAPRFEPQVPCNDGERVGRAHLLAAVVHGRGLPDRLPGAPVVGRQQRVLVVGIGLQPGRPDTASAGPNPTRVRRQGRSRSPAAESQSLPGGALTPSVTRSGRCVRVLIEGARPASRLPASPREQLAHTANATTSSSRRRIADTVWRREQDDPACAGAELQRLNPGAQARPRLLDHGDDALPTDPARPPFRALTGFGNRRLGARHVDSSRRPPRPGDESQRGPGNRRRRAGPLSA